MSFKAFWNTYIWYTAPRTNTLTREWSLELMEEHKAKETKLQKAYWSTYRFFKNVLDFPHDLYYNIKYAYQRVIRGWSDRDTWSIDYHLSTIIPEMMRHLKKVKHGIPTKCFEDPFSDTYSKEAEEKAIAKWDEILDTIIYTFDTYKLISEHNLIMAKDEEEKKSMQKFCDNMNKKYPGQYRLMTDVEVERYEQGWKYFQEYWGSFWD
jgi:hypothetical protein